MPNLTLRNIPTDVYKFLQKSAKSNGRSLNAEILSILTDELNLAIRRLEMKRSLPELTKLRQEIAAKHPVQINSVDLIREDRDSR